MFRSDRSAPTKEEIEATPEMIEAGSSVIQDPFVKEFLDRVVAPSLGAEGVFRAMISRLGVLGNNLEE